MLSSSFKKILNKLAGVFGYRVHRIPTYSYDSFTNQIESVLQQAEEIPGMINREQQLSYYWICFSQSLEGAVVEIGCWQGRSTLMLASACRDSGNGIVHAIDHFLGNPDKQEFYIVDKDDLSDLEENFRRNLAAVDLDPFVEVHPLPSSDVIISDDIRLLVVDGEHTREAVLRDWRAFRHRLLPGAIAIFDDYSVVDFPGVVQAVNEIHVAEPGSSLTLHGRMAAIRLPLPTLPAT